MCHLKAIAVSQEEFRNDIYHPLLRTRLYDLHDVIIQIF